MISNPTLGDTVGDDTQRWKDCESDNENQCAVAVKAQFNRQSNWFRKAVLNLGPPLRQEVGTNPPTAVGRKEPFYTALFLDSVSVLISNSNNVPSFLLDLYHDHGVNIQVHIHLFAFSGGHWIQVFLTLPTSAHREIKQAALVTRTPPRGVQRRPTPSTQPPVAAELRQTQTSFQGKQAQAPRLAVVQVRTPNKYQHRR